MADLTPQLNFSFAADCIELASYHNFTSAGRINLIRDATIDIAGKDVLIVEDIVDTGRTLQFLHSHLSAKNPLSLRVCTLLDNPERRLMDSPSPDYVGFTIPNKFVVGYGLDYDQEYRNLPYIATISGGH